MIKLYDGQITDLLQNGGKHNPELKALSFAVLQEKRRIIDEARQTRTLSLIDELPEKILDILAVELRNPFYQEDFEIEAKRGLIKESLILYTYMGTPEAVSRMLSAVYPDSYIEEWQDYGGEPFYFRIVVDTTKNDKADSIKIIKGVQKVKRLTAHLDKLVYQCSIGFKIKSSGQGYTYRAKSTGKTRAGTAPWKSTKGGLANGEILINSSAVGTKYSTPQAGTKPSRSTHFGQSPETSKITTSAEGYPYTVKSAGRAESGTEPLRNFSGEVLQGDFITTAEGKAYSYKTDMCGTKYCGQKRRFL